MNISTSKPRKCTVKMLNNLAPRGTTISRCPVRGYVIEISGQPEASFRSFENAREYIQEKKKKLY